VEQEGQEVGLAFRDQPWLYLAVPRDFLRDFWRRRQGLEIEAID